MSGWEFFRRATDFALGVFCAVVAFWVIEQVGQPNTPDSFWGTLGRNPYFWPILILGVLIGAGQMAKAFGPDTK